ncbi:hypothetical protein ACQKPE_15475 [Pseudomonas sp. NPDC089554]|uniref:hypothetical protein n=1 Tax=Pseudomonas sp. NPDC089554 TaxID=3390653 RepID=UPI003D03E87F
MLERLSQWGEAFATRLGSQPGWFDLLEEQLFIELATYLPEATFVDAFVDNLIDTLLQRRIDQALPAYDTSTDGPARWGDSSDYVIPEPRREILTQVVEAMSERLVSVYTDALARHWQAVPEDLQAPGAYRLQLQALLDAHSAELAALFDSVALQGQTAQGLRAQMEDFEARWRSQSVLRALATQAQAEHLDQLGRRLQADWVNGLSSAEQDALKATQARLDDALALYGALMEGAQTLHAYACVRAERYLFEETGYRMDPERIVVHRRFADGYQTDGDTLSLAALVATGPVDGGQVYLLERFEAPRRYAHALSSEQLGELLATLDAPADYLQALTTRYSQDDVNSAMSEMFEARLQHSLLIARYAGHVEGTLADQVEATASAEGGPLQVRTLGLLPGSSWCDLLLFYREDAQGVPGKHVLYAPGKPDGQEWVEANSLLAITEEIVGWLDDEAGRQYLVGLTPHTLRSHALEQYARLALNVSSWDPSRDLRGLPVGYEACLRELLESRQIFHLGDVQAQDSPDWYRRLSAGERRLQNADRQRAQRFEQAFERHMAGYETFQAYVRRTVAERIAPYLRSVGVSEMIDPQTILIDYAKNDSGTLQGTMTLLELALHGYDDNSGIDNPAHGVRSSLGQNLEAVRSAPLASFARSAYLGQHYVQAMTAKYLDSTHADYAVRRTAFNRMLVAMLDRDLRQALGQAHVSTEVHPKLARLVSSASAWGTPSERPLNPESVATSEGIFRLTLDDVPVLGVYVYRLIENGRAQDWLYTPSAPDHRLLRPYAELRGERAVVLHDYLVARTTQANYEAASAFLVRLAAQRAHLDALREQQRVRNLVDQFDAYLQHGLDDVSQVTRTRAQVIRAQVLKGAFAFALPLSLVCPPFALLMDMAFVVAALRAALIAHGRGETQRALMGWMEASWALLGVGLVAGAAVGSLRSLASLKATKVTRAPGHETLGMDTRWALEQRPAGLGAAQVEGVWRGTRLADDGNHYVRYRGRYYQLQHQGSDDFLRVVSARRPEAAYKLPVRVTADGRLHSVIPGLRGGNPTQERGWVHAANAIFPGRETPSTWRGAMQGEGVHARFQAAGTDNYLFTVNVQSCVGVSLYNAADQVGAVLHIDHNVVRYISPLIRAAVEKVRNGNDAASVSAVMVGGDWLSTASIGGPVRRLLRREGLEPVWKHWSYSSLVGANTYGMTLDLQSGITSVYRTTQHFVEQLYEAHHVAVLAGRDVMSERMLRFMWRVDPAKTRALLPDAAASTGDPKAFILLDVNHLVR